MKPFIRERERHTEVYWPQERKLSRKCVKVNFKDSIGKTCPSLSISLIETIPKHGTTFVLALFSIKDKLDFLFLKVKSIQSTAGGQWDLMLTSWQKPLSQAAVQDDIGHFCPTMSIHFGHPDSGLQLLWQNVLHCISLTCVWGTQAEAKGKQSWLV